MNKALIRSAASKPRSCSTQKEKQKMNATQMMASARKGVTLVELLVVILIVTILSVSLLPLLKPYIVKAQYAAEPVPVLGNLRTQIGMFQYEKDYLPGMPRDLKGTVLNASASGKMCDVISQNAMKQCGGDSRLANASSGLQTFIETNDVTATSLTVYEKAIWDANLTTLLNTNTVLNAQGDGSPAVDQWKNHFSEDIRVNYADFTGKRMRPQHIQYRAIYGGYKTGAYAYVVGCFGDANGLAAGTGYAMIEIVNPKYNVKYVGTWERYKKVGDSNEQIKIQDLDESKVSLGKDAKELNLCWIGDPTTYLTQDDGDGASIVSGISELQAAGWEF